MQGEGYWADPKGNVFEVPSTHIRAVLDDPSKYGLSKDDLAAIYRRHGEKLGMEGKARREIILQLLYNGWVQIRDWGEGRYDGWMVNYWGSSTSPSRIRTIMDKLVDMKKASYRDSMTLHAWGGTVESPSITKEQDFLSELDGDGGVLQFLAASLTKDLEDAVSSSELAPLLSRTNDSVIVSKIEKVLQERFPGFAPVFSYYEPEDSAITFFTADGFKRRFRVLSNRSVSSSTRVEGLAEALADGNEQIASHLIMRSLQ